MSEPKFLSLDEALAIHAHQIARYGGSPGVRDIRLLESAVAMPEATYASEFVHGDVFEMAAAYLFHIAKNHPFVDGNKRAALSCCLVFLELNRQSVQASEAELVEMVLGVAGGGTSKSQVAVLLREYAG